MTKAHVALIKISIISDIFLYKNVKKLSIYFYINIKYKICAITSSKSISTSSSTSSRTDTKWLTFSIEKTIGGFSFKTLLSGPSLLTMIFLSFILDTTCFASAVAGILLILSRTNSIPMNNPAPRTSPIIFRRFASFFNSAIRWLPTCKAFSCRFSRSMISITAFATAQDTGLPPYWSERIKFDYYKIFFFSNTHFTSWHQYTEKK